MKSFLCLCLFLFFFAVSGYAQDDLTRLKNGLRSQARFLEEEFGVPVELTFPATGICLAEGGSDEVHICEYLLRKLLKHYGPDRSLAIATFILFHEQGHSLFADNSDEIPFDRLTSSTELSAKALETISYHLLHENLDGLAAKLFRQLELPYSDAVYDFLLNMVEFASEAQRMSPAEAEFFRRVQKSRGDRFLEAYREGWADWKGYNKLWTPCGVDGREKLPLLYLRARALDAAAMGRSVGTQACQLYDLPELSRTLRVYSRRLR